MLVVSIGMASAGQAEGSNASPAEKRQQADDLLRRARELMAKNDLAGADSLIAKAEGLNPQYPPIFFGDTPKKARQALEGMRSAAGGAPSKPSQMFSPFGVGKPKAPPSDPFAARPIGNVADPTAVESSPDTQRPSRLPTTGRPDAGNSPGASPFGRPLASAPPTEDDLNLPPALARGYAPASASAQVVGPNNPGNAVASSDPGAAGTRAQSDDLLRSARRALAVGDARRATELAAQAKQFQVRYEPLDDSPEKVEAAIAKHQEVGSQDKNSESYRRNYARLLMEEAEALFRWNEYEHAEQLASLAARLPVSYGAFEAKPEELLTRIAVARRGAGLAAEPSPAANPSGPATLGISLAAKQQVTELVRQARAALANGQLDQAESLAKQAEQMRIPDSSFQSREDRPALVLLDIRQARQRSLAGAVAPAGGAFASDGGASRAVYDPYSDSTRNITASNQQLASPETLRTAYSDPGPSPSGTPPTAAGPGQQSPGYALFQQGEAALKAHDGNRALELFRQAAPYMNEMDQVTAQRLQEHLQLLSAAPNRRPGQSGQPGQPGSPLDEAAARQRTLAAQVTKDLAIQQSTARKMCEKDPKGALALLEQARKKVESSGLEPAYRDQLLRRVDRDLADTQRFIEQNGPRIELASHNEQVRQDLARDQKSKGDMQQKLAALVDEYNRKLDEHSYAEAEVIAKKAAELAPREPVAMLMLHQSKVNRELDRQRQMRDAKEAGVRGALDSVEEAATPMDDLTPIHFPDGRTWRELSRVRARRVFEQKHRFSEREIEIQKRLKTPVSVSFKGTPLSKAIETLSKMTGVNIHIDEEALKQEGISPDAPVTLEVNEITLRSVLNLILNNHHLAYVVKDEVLKVTSEQMRAGQVYTVTYNVADLVMPIPNFVGGPNLGMVGALNNAMTQVHGPSGGGLPFGAATTPMAVVANEQGKHSTGAINPALMAQINTRQPGVGGGPRNVPVGGGMGGGGGPGGAGGGANADFDSLMDLITSTVQPTTWDAVGGPGSIAPFETNLSIVVSQTQEVHEEIVDLLEQLRRMQDLQVTIEVRFITLNDNFFERMGVDFDFNIKGNSTSDPAAAGFTDVQPVTISGNTIGTRTRGTGSNGTAVVGLQNIGNNPAQTGVFTQDLSIPFQQGSYALAVPQFGGFDAAAGASLGFAILSDIEAFFFVNAAQGDKRSNVLQAPKVTLFNGQQAFVSDTSQTPFVISVVPVVGDFAAAQQPVIVVLSEGTFMTVQAVVSNDRRFVRLTIVPFFSKIGDVKTFTFQGTETTTTDVTREGLLDATKGTFNRNNNNRSTARSGTTVQLPTFSFVTVTTTVSVPDGGTVLLGGIKRLSEGRSEFGVPILDKVPYLNRLFKNVGIGRDTSSLMMMVTPRIIIQEEEEEKLGVTPSP
jgi:general secretion pathway protein D